MAQQKERLENYREEIKKIIEQKGGLRSLVRNYDNTEIKYNTRYKENLSRNILGIYEPGMLEIKQETYEQEVKKSLQENKKKKEKLQNTNEEIYKKERMLEEKKEQYIQKNVEIEQTIEEKNSYEQEIEERKDILKYLELPQEKLFAREEILHKAWGKIEELEDRKRKLEKKKILFERNINY